MPMHPLLEELLKRLPNDCEERVKRAKDSYNQLIRNRLMHDMRMNLRSRRSLARVESEIPIRIVPGIPNALESITQSRDEDYPAELLGIWDRDVSDLARSSHNLLPVLLQIRDYDALRPEADPVYVNALSLVVDHSELLAQTAKRARLARLVFGIQTDVAGSYSPSFFDKDGEIELYWAAIGLCAELVQVSVESLTAVILTHELAHGYAHLGKDADDKFWDTDHMCKKVETPVLEGLAQYYTDIISEYLGDWENPEIHTAYLRSRRRQGGAYRVHDHWVRKYTPEVVRTALVKFRRDNKCSFAEFENLLTEAKAHLKAEDRELHSRVEDDIRRYGPAEANLERLLHSIREQKRLKMLFFANDTEMARNCLAESGLGAWVTSVSLALGWKLAITSEFEQGLKNAPINVKSHVLGALASIARAPIPKNGDASEQLDPVWGFWSYPIGTDAIIYLADRDRQELVIADIVCHA